jgi:RNA polymerase sigma-70 factor, ECF subfamily
MLDEIKVKRAIKGDDKSFLELINTQSEKLYKIAYAYVKNEQNALDIIQETVYNAYMSISKLKEPKYFNTWLIKILINESLSSIKKEKNLTHFNNNISEDRTNYISKSENKLDILLELDKIDKKYRDIIILKYFDDLTSKEISEILEIPLGTVKTYLHRGISILKKSMEENGYEY